MGHTEQEIMLAVRIEYRKAELSDVCFPVASESSFGGSPSESSVDFILGKTVNRARSSVHSSSSQTHLSHGGERLGVIVCAVRSQARKGSAHQPRSS